MDAGHAPVRYLLAKTNAPVDGADSQKQNAVYTRKIKAIVGCPGKPPYAAKLPNGARHDLHHATTFLHGLYRVQLPVKAHYATIAMIELANRSPDAPPVSLRAIAAKHQIPLPFLTQIFQQLRAAGLANSVRGASGGFLLQRSPESISIAEIVDAVCPGPPSSTVSGKTAEHAAVQQIWDGLDELIKNHLRGLLLSELVEQTQPAQATMFYI